MKERGPDRRKSAGRRAGELGVQTGARTAAGPPLMTCPHCGSVVPAGDFCGHCGAHLTSGSTTRRHAFAAVPAEHVAHVSIITTLFPHLPHRQGGPFRLALLAGGALVLVLAAVHLFAPATVVAVCLLPALYLMYLYEVEVYESEPWIVVGATMVAGVVLGWLFELIAGGTLARLSITGDMDTAFALSALAVPIVAQSLMLAGPLFLYAFRTRFREPLDGLTFGAASALGFTLASTLTSFWPLITGPLFAPGSPIDWAVRLTRAGLLVALINASTTALVAAAVWLQRYGRRRADRPWYTRPLACVLVAYGAQIALGAFESLPLDLVAQVAGLAILTVALLLYVRFLIHQALLVEGAEHEIGHDTICPECHRIVPAMTFCPACGAARAAAPKGQRHSAPGNA